MLTQEQITERLNYVTGSDAGVIAGFNRYKTKVQLWLEKTGRAVQEDISGANYIKFGNFMEDGVANWFMAESGRVVCKEPAMLVHPEYNWMAGNIDFRVIGENAILECKTAGSTDGWGDGENIIPDHYLMQVAHYCAVGGFDRAYIAVVFTFTREMRWYIYDRNVALEQKLIKIEHDFWFNNVKTDVAPIAKTEEDVLALYRTTTENPMIASDEIATHVYSLDAVKTKIKELEAEEQVHRDAIATFMCDSEILIDVSGAPLITWKMTAPVNSFDKKALEKDDPELVKKYTNVGNPQRKFLVKVKK